MPNHIGVDSRLFLRKGRKLDGSSWKFESVLGVGIRTRDLIRFEEKYSEALSAAFKKFGLEQDFKYYCWKDLASLPQGTDVLEHFFSEMSSSIYTMYVFYTLFSKKQQSEVQVYGRMARRLKLKLSDSTRTHEQLRSQHLSQCFPSICAWKISFEDKLELSETTFHLDSYGGHITEAQEELEKSPCGVLIYPNGDCSSSLISTADLMVHLLDHRLERRGKTLIFENIRPVFPELGEKVIAYPILNQHFPKITPVDNKPIEIVKFIKHPVYWVFKTDPNISNDTLRSSKAYRNLIDIASMQSSVVKSFNRSTDEDEIRDGDYGVYFDSRGKETVENFNKFGKPLVPFSLDLMVPKEPKNR